VKLPSRTFWECIKNGNGQSKNGTCAYDDQMLRKTAAFEGKRDDWLSQFCFVY